MIFFCRSSLERALKQFVSRYHSERNHQGLSNQLLHGWAAVGEPSRGPVKRLQRLGGMLNFYYRAAATQR